MNYTIRISKKISYFLVLSMILSVFAAPITAEAGILGKILSAVKPYAGTLGNLGGAVAGAVMGASFLPPVGILAGGIAGYVVGGILANYAAGGLSNIATLGGAALGVMAGASFGPIGYVVGALGGGLLGKIAMSLLYKLDKKTTGGILLSPAVDSSGEPILVGSTSQTSAVGDIPAAAPISDVSGADELKVTEELNASANDISQADAEYQEAYRGYIVAVRTGSTETIKEAHEKYKNAFNRYKKLTGKDPQ